MCGDDRVTCYPGADNVSGEPGCLVAEWGISIHGDFSKTIIKFSCNWNCCFYSGFKFVNVNFGYFGYELSYLGL